MTYQADDNEIYVTVTDKKTGLKIDANDFNVAVYEITTLAGTMIFRAELTDNITVDSGDFKIIYPRTESLTAGDHQHEMRVKDISGKESTIVQIIIKNNTTRIRL
jgi:hypothetical protein